MRCRQVPKQLRAIVAGKTWFSNTFACTMHETDSQGQGYCVFATWTVAPWLKRRIADRELRGGAPVLIMSTEAHGPAVSSSHGQQVFCLAWPVTFYSPFRLPCSRKLFTTIPTVISSGAQTHRQTPLSFYPPFLVLSIFSHALLSHTSSSAFLRMKLFPNSTSFSAFCSIAPVCSIAVLSITDLLFFALGQIQLFTAAIKLQSTGGEHEVKSQLHVQGGTRSWRSQERNHHFFSKCRDI